MADEPKKKNPIEATGSAVAGNVKRLREEQRLPFTELAAILEAIGRPIPTLGLRHIEACRRRVDSDDLVALSVALGVSPVTLLMPRSENGHDEVAVTGVDYPLAATSLWFWLRGSTPLPGDDRLPLVFQSAAWPVWRLRQQIEQDKRTQGAWLAARRDQKDLEADGDD